MQYGNSAKVWLSLGSNVGDRKQTLTLALETLGREPDLTLKCVSSLYETEPWGNTDQSSFYNLAVEIGTAFEPLELLNAAKLIERQLGRKPGPRWGPRVIDIDIVLWETVVLDTPELTIPHPSFQERAFVLVPLCEIAPMQIDPVSGSTVEALLDGVAGKTGVSRVEAEIEIHSE
ncbi:MAG TPA: 2-amino-4-hydroxy-6-hydroxymethyldihydropteridine diphosphokinase [Candidatus Hydrogenedentes bacterium]|nr:2-amino-4-hydroxy-6-hydroxymethyldihydropteridine diphosphokinase [Candidatus Hydrogenedentota bacterium]